MFFDKIDDQYKDRSEFNEELVKIYLVLMLQVISGIIKKDDKSIVRWNKDIDEINTRTKNYPLWEAIAIFDIYDSSMESYKKRLEINENTKKSYDFELNISLRINNILAKDIWYNLVFDCNYSKEDINISIKRDYEKIFHPPRLNNLQLFNNRFMEMNPSDLKKSLDNLMEDFQEGKYLTYYEIRSIVKRLDQFLGMNILPPEKNDDYYVGILDDFIKRHGEQIIKNEEEPIYDTYYSNACEMENEKLRNIVKKIRKMAIEARKKQISETLSHQFEEENNQEIASFFASDPLNVYYTVPLLKYMNIDALFNYIIKQNIRCQERILIFFRKRYGNFYDNSKLPKEYYPDIAEVEKLSEKYQEFYEGQDRLYNIKIYEYYHLSKGYKDLVIYMKEQETASNSDVQ